MIPLPITDVVTALGVSVNGVGGRSVRGLSIDSRRIRSGDCFFALDGDRVRGLDYVDAAFAAGASLAVATEATATTGPVAVVEDPGAALITIASLVRQRFHGPVVGITGSVGKTGLKDALATLIPARFSAVAPVKSFNNRIGVPLTLGEIESTTRVVILELGTNAKGEIEELTTLARPTIGVLTAIGPAHLLGLSSVEGVLEEKMALACGLPEGATLFVNGDDPILRTAMYPSHVHVRRVGLEGEGSERPQGIEGDALIVAKGRRIPVATNSKVALRNAWMAYTVAQSLGVTDDELVEGAKRLRPSPLRGEHRVVAKATVILDCYNANPLSMQGALLDLSTRPGRRVAVLGTMRELGSFAEEHHRALGGLLSNVDALLFVGEFGDLVAAAAVRAGLDSRSIHVVATVPEAQPIFDSLVAEPGWVLVKASRALALERLLGAPHD